MINFGDQGSQNIRAGRIISGRSITPCTHSAMQQAKVQNIYLKELQIIFPIGWLRVEI